MSTHDFPDEQKVRGFCLTPSGEARLWYETLNAQQQQLDWTGLQECFWQQYSKFGNTREQYFHALRSFHFDEATDTIDGYIQKVKKVAALLNYGEPQILELFKNTLLSRLYYMLYQINGLRVAVETAKRLLTKQQMDKKSGQATASPFMQISQGNSKSKSKAEKNKKKVSFSDVEAIERTTNSIERLASLMDKMDTKLDRREDQYRPRIYQGRGRGHSYRRNNYRSRNRSYSRDWYQNNYRGRGNYNREALRFFLARRFCHGKEYWSLVAIGVTVRGQTCLLALGIFSSSLLRMDRDGALCSRDMTRVILSLLNVWIPPMIFTFTSISTVSNGSRHLKYPCRKLHSDLRIQAS